LQYYPIYLNITNKRCMVVGGGEVGERKAAGLLACGADVVVVSRDLTPALQGLKEEGKIGHIAADYWPGSLDGAFMVIGATDNEAVNGQIAEEARARGILANIVDDPTKGDFILPALVRQGDLTIAISTGGKSPALAKKLRSDLEALFGQEYALFLDMMGEIRQRVAELGGSAEERKQIFQALVDSELLSRMREKDRGGVGECLKCINRITGLDLDVRGKRM